MAELETCPAKCGVTGLNTKEKLAEHLTACPNLIRRCTCCPASGYIAVLRDETMPCVGKFARNQNQERIQGDAECAQLSDLLRDLDVACDEHRAVEEAISTQLKAVNKRL